MKEKLIDLIFTNWKTTTVGLGLMLVAFTLVAMEKASLAEVGGFFAIALPLLFIKDPKDGKS